MAGKSHPVLGDSLSIVALASVNKTAQGPALRALVNRKIESLRADIEERADITEAVFRRNAGMISGLKWVLARIDEAEECLSKFDKE